MKLREKVGRRIRNWRRLQDIKQEALAERIGVNKSTLSKLENGAIEINLTTVEKIATALNMSPEILLCKDPGELISKSG